jgi:hypothetical protein
MVAQIFMNLSTNLLDIVIFSVKLAIPVPQIPDASGRKPTSEVIVAPWKSIMMVRLKSGRITSFWLSPLLSIFEPPDLLIIPPYII